MVLMVWCCEYFLYFALSHHHRRQWHVIWSLKTYEGDDTRIGNAFTMYYMACISSMISIGIAPGFDYIGAR